MLVFWSSSLFLKVRFLAEVTDCCSIRGRSSMTLHRFQPEPSPVRSVFSHRCSPSQWVGPARYTPPPIKMEEMPEIDGVVISHAHYDHLDVSTIKYVFYHSLVLHLSKLTYRARHLFSAAQPKGSVHFFVPLGNKKWFASAIGTKESDVTEFDWWDHASFTTPAQTHSSLRVTCTPCQHFANRSLFDRNHTLWASWAIEQLPTRNETRENKIQDDKPICKIWFGGDTAYRGVHSGMTREEELKMPYCPVFEEIGEKFKFFDFAVSPLLRSSKVVAETCKFRADASG